MNFFKHFDLPNLLCKEAEACDEIIDPLKIHGVHDDHKQGLILHLALHIDAEDDA